MTVQKTNNNTTLIKKHLSVQVSLNGLCFLTHSITTRELLHQQEITFPATYTPEETLLKIKDTLAENAAEFSNITEVVVVHQNTLFSLVPKELFNEASLASYLKLNVSLFDNDYIAFDDIDTHGIVVVYVPFTNINNYFFDLFGEFTYQHSSGVFINNILKEVPNSSSKMHVYLYEKQMDILVRENNSLRLFNSFQHSCPEDLIYYILFIAEQLQLDPEVFPLEFYGKISEEDSYYKIAYTYIRNVSINRKNYLSKV